MLLKKNLLAATLCATAISSFAMAQDNVVIPPAPQMLQTAPTDVQSPVVEMPTNQDASAALQYIEIDPTSVNTPVITPIDKNVIDDVLSFYSNQDIESIISAYGEYEMMMVDHEGVVLRNREDLRRYLVELFASKGKQSYKATTESIRDISTGTGLLSGAIDVFLTPNDVTPKSKLMFTMLAKHDGVKWKISHFQATEVKQNANVDAGQDDSSESSIRMMVIALIGAVIGFFISKLIPKKSQ